MSDATKGVLTGVVMVIVGLVIVNFLVLPNHIGPGGNWLSNFVFFEGPFILMIAGGGLTIVNAIRLLIGAAQRGGLRG